MVKSRIEVHDEGVKILLKDFNKFFSPPETKSLLTEAAHIGAAGISERTAAGKDVDNKFFEPYSPVTVFFRKEKGRPTNRVDLFFTGKMLISMSVKATAHHALLYFSPREAEKASRHQTGTKKLPQRKFFAISADDMEGISELIEERLDKVGSWL